MVAFSKELRGFGEIPKRPEVSSQALAKMRRRIENMRKPIEKPATTLEDRFYALIDALKSQPRVGANLCLVRSRMGSVYPYILQGTNGEYIQTKYEVITDASKLLAIFNTRFTTTSLRFKVHWVIVGKVHLSTTAQHHAISIVYDSHKGKWYLFDPSADTLYMDMYNALKQTRPDINVIAGDKKQDHQAFFEHIVSGSCSLASFFPVYVLCKIAGPNDTFEDVLNLSYKCSMDPTKFQDYMRAIVIMTSEFIQKAFQKNNKTTYNNFTGTYVTKKTNMNEFMRNTNLARRMLSYSIIGKTRYELENDYDQFDREVYATEPVNPYYQVILNNLGHRIGIIYE